MSKGLKPVSRPLGRGTCLRQSGWLRAGRSVVSKLAAFDHAQTSVAGVHDRLRSSLDPILVFIVLEGKPLRPSLRFGACLQVTCVLLDDLLHYIDRKSTRLNSSHLGI